MEWIKCSERMPEKDSDLRVLAYSENDDMTIKYRLIAPGLFKQVCREATHWIYVTPPEAE